MNEHARNVAEVLHLARSSHAHQVGPRLSNHVCRDSMSRIVVQYSSLSQPCFRVVGSIIFHAATPVLCCRGLMTRTTVSSRAWRRTNCGPWQLLLTFLPPYISTVWLVCSVVGSSSTKRVRALGMSGIDCQSWPPEQIINMEVASQQKKGSDGSS